MATATIPTILFVHGSWHSPEHWKPLRELCESNGIPTTCPLQPTFGALPPIGMEDDAKCIRKELKRLVEQEHKEAIVFAHSYGGLVASEAVDADLSKAAREENGQKGGVVRIMYLAAFFLPPGVSLARSFGFDALPVFIPEDDKGTCMMVNPAIMFYNDMPDEQAQHWVSLLKRVPSSTQLTGTTQAAYLHHPVTYIFCEKDQGPNIDYQRRIVEDIRKADGIQVDEEICNTGHSPYLSQPETILKFIQNAMPSKT